MQRARMTIMLTVFISWIFCLLGAHLAPARQKQKRVSNIVGEFLLILSAFLVTSALYLVWISI